MLKSTRRTMVSASGGFLRSPLRNLILGVLYMLVVVATAIVCYVKAGWSPADALYMAVITVFTVGYDEVRPIATPLLRTITIGTIVLGCTGMIFLTGALVQFITLGQLTEVLGFKRMTTQIDRLRNHVVICGFGRIGQMLSRGLQAGGMKFVILEESESAVAAARASGYLCLQADATDEDTLRSAGIEHARALATVLPNDAANVFITLSARSLNPKLEIIARGEIPSTERKLLHAGANKVVLPTHIGAERIAEMILYQETEHLIHGTQRMRDFEKVLLSLGLDIDLVVAAPESTVIGRTIEQVELQGNGAFFIVQINRRGGSAVTRPEPDTVVEDGDGLVLVGRGPQFRAMGALFEPGRR